MHSVGDLVMCFGDFNAHVGRHFDGVYGVFQRNLEGRMLSVIWKRKYVCQVHCLRERKRGR